MAAVESAVDTALAAPTQANAEAALAAALTLRTNARDSLSNITETGTLGVGSRSISGSRISPEIHKLANAVAHEILHLQTKGALHRRPGMERPEAHLPRGRLAAP